MVTDVFEIKIITQRVIAKAQAEFGLKMVSKRDSKLMRFIYRVALMRFWNPNFMTSSTTTIGRTMYLSRPVDSFGIGSIADLALLNHELQHIMDASQYRFAHWAFLYLFPQSLTPLGLLGFFEPMMFLFLLCLAPLPAPFRVWAEVRGYARGLATRARMGLIVGPLQFESYHGVFTGWSYYRMAWRWKPVRKSIERTFDLMMGRAN